MKKIIAIFVLIVVFVVALFFLNKRQTRQVNDYQLSSPSPSASPSLEASQSPAASMETENKLIEIIITPERFSQNNLVVQVGSTVKFTNKDILLHWPASDPHPTHTLCPGFDSNHGLKQNESYSFTFDKKMVCSFHDHLHSKNIGFNGIITVK